ncbi:MAG: 4-hydroxy-tetrahydrodipicolinate reductase [Halieaceae bacterium]|nr:4-hydroxy-tetrahydrodipicolinate reductase [Halieaceae bacterium]
MIPRIAIAGGDGRMGRVLIDLVSRSDALQLAAVSAPAGAPVEAVPGELCFTSAGDALAAADVFVDFTSPEAIAEHAKAVVATHTAWVLGTTGLNGAQQALVEDAARSVAVCQAANFSTGVTLMLKLAELAARAVDADTDLEIIEAHHRHKVDAPSGTALALGRALAAGRGVDLDERAVFCREGITGERPDGAIGFATVRGGDIVGDHTVLFASEGERLEITHRAGTREAFARGALRAAHWLQQQPPGLYNMHDVLKLNT